MSTTAVPPSNSPPGRKTAASALLALVQDPRQMRDWLRVTPNWLQAAIVAMVLLSAAFSLAIRYAALKQIETIKTIEKDSAPSIVAGQGMRANLADMHSNLANELLVAPGKEGEQAVKDFDKRRKEAADDLLKAAKNITYPGEEEAVRTILNELPRYEEDAGRARVLHDQHDSKFVDAHQAADEIMRLKLLPAIVDLIAVNQRELDKAYDEEKTAATVAWLLVLLTGAAQLAAIAGLKVLLYRRMRRIVNPPLLAAAVLTAGGCLWALVALWQSSADIKVAKEDAFDSIKVLQAARAIAYDANGDESRWLLVKMHKGSQADQIEFYADAFHSKAKEIAGYPGSWSDVQLRAAIDRTPKTPATDHGYMVPAGYSASELNNDQAAGKRLAGGLTPEACLAKELNNITFEGELSVAADTLLKFLDYLKIDGQIRKLAAEDEKKAVELCVGTQPDQSNWAFDRFAAALDKTIAINQSAFDSSLPNARSWLAGLDGLLPLGLALAVSLLTFLGLRPRLNEYAVY